MIHFVLIAPLNPVEGETEVETHEFLEKYFKAHGIRPFRNQTNLWSDSFDGNSGFSAWLGMVGKFPASITRRMKSAYIIRISDISHDMINQIGTNK